MAAVVLASACTSDPAPGPADPGPAGGSTPGTTLAPAGVDADLPTTAREYAEATVGAWAAPDLARLSRLATPRVHAALLDLPGPPDPRWSFVGCDEAADEVDCAFHNSEGDELVVRVDVAGLGEPRAATDVDYEPTRYPDDPLSYVEEFVTAWRDGNLTRMHALAAPAVVDLYRGLAPEPAPGHDPGADDVVVVTLGETEIVTEVEPDLLGGPGAIVAARPPAA